MNGNFHLIKLATSAEYKRDTFSTNVKYFCEFWFFHYEKSMRFSPWKIGKYTRWVSCWDQYSWASAIPGNCHLWTEISKRQLCFWNYMLLNFFWHYAFKNLALHPHMNYYDFTFCNLPKILPDVTNCFQLKILIATIF